jgi:hypothetical protein
MTHRLTLTILSSALSLMGFAAQAQSLEEMRIELKTLRDELNELKKSQLLEKPSGNPPLLDERIRLLESKSAESNTSSDLPGGFKVPGSSTSLRIYGFAEGHAIHDFKQSGSSDNFTDLASQPLDSTNGRRGRTNFTVETSRLGFESATPTAKGPLNTKVEVDFYSYTEANRNRLRLRHAYGEWNGWLIGQTWSTFMDIDDLPETVDFNGAVGAPFSRRTMVRYAFGDDKAGYKLTFSAEDPKDQFGGGSSGERTPQLIARFDKTFDRGAFNMRALTHGKRSATQSKRGYGVGFSGRFKLTARDVFMGQYTQVNGDIDHLFGSNGYAIDAPTGDIAFDKNQGLVMGYSRTFNGQLRGNVVLGLNRGKAAQALDNRSLQQLFANLIFSPVKNLELGGEVIYGKRKNFIGEVGTMLRLDLMARYSF